MNTHTYRAYNILRDPSLLGDRSSELPPQKHTILHAFILPATYTKHTATHVFPYSAACPIHCQVPLPCTQTHMHTQSLIAIYTHACADTQSAAYAHSLKHAPPQGLTISHTVKSSKHCNGGEEFGGEGLLPSGYNQWDLKIWTNPLIKIAGSA